MDIIINLEIKNNVILVCAIFLFVCVEGEGGGEVCPCFTAENWGQTLFKLGTWIKKGTDLV